MTIIVTLTTGKLTAHHQLYNAFLDNEPLVTAVRDPEPAACRELARRGYSGPVAFFWGERPGLIVKDLHAFAKKTTLESNKRGPVMVPHREERFPSLREKAASAARTGVPMHAIA